MWVRVMVAVVIGKISSAIWKHQERFEKVNQQYPCGEKKIIDSLSHIFKCDLVFRQFGLDSNSPQRYK
jgi:hypothetical protein